MFGCLFIWFWIFLRPLPPTLWRKKSTTIIIWYRLSRFHSWPHIDCYCWFATADIVTGAVNIVYASMWSIEWKYFFSIFGDVVCFSEPLIVFYIVFHAASSPDSAAKILKNYYERETMRACVCVPRTVALGQFVNRRVCIASIVSARIGNTRSDVCFTAANNRKSPTASIDLYIFECENLHFNLEMKRCRASCQWIDELKHAYLECRTKNNILKFHKFSSRLTHHTFYSKPSLFSLWWMVQKTNRNLALSSSTLQPDSAAIFRH